MSANEVRGCVVLAMRRAGCGQEMIRQVLQALDKEAQHWRSKRNRH